MTKWNYEKGWQEVGPGVYAYLQPDGSWGLSNAGLVADGGQALLIDTLYDLHLTAEMLQSLGRILPSVPPITTLVNTHSNGDHWFGNQLVRADEIISSKAAAEEMPQMPPAFMDGLMKGAGGMGGLGQYLLKGFGRYDYEGITPTLPTRTFEGRLDLEVGGLEVHLIEVGPCHTRGDLIVLIPSAKVAFAGDIVFHGAHPILWEGPVKNWIKALDIMLEADVEVVVPGHGPLGGTDCLEETRAYFHYLMKQAQIMRAQGLNAAEAAFALDLRPFSHWSEDERVVVNMDSIYRELDQRVEKTNVLELFGLMAKMAGYE